MQKTIAGLLFSLVLMMAFQCCRTVETSDIPKFTAAYQAVFLSNGQVYFGKVEKLDTQYPVLKDVFYVVSQVNSETKEAANVLVRRGKELHGPEYMVLNRSSILMVEPVREDSPVAKLIAEQLKQAK